MTISLQFIYIDSAWGYTIPSLQLNAILKIITAIWEHKEKDPYKTKREYEQCKPDFNEYPRCRM